MDEFGQEGSMQAAVVPVSSLSARPSGDPLPALDRRTWLVAIPLALVVIYAFIPVLANGFVLWDDNETFLENPYFRGLGAAQVKWAWTTTSEGLYHPLAWMFFEAQYVLWQLDPRGYHLTSLLLQVANAVVLYVLTVALLARCRADSCFESPWTRSLSAGLATALFAVHPLRAEVVAWATVQKYLPCTLFSMLSVLAYLRAFQTSSSPRWGWLVGSFLLFVVALLFLPAVVSLPAVLLILDVYPLRRFPDAAGRWFSASTWRALLEKVPFVMTSLLFMGLAIAARPASRFPGQHDDISVGIARACYAICFSIWKTLLPLDLIAVYPLPRELNWLAPPYSLCILATLAISAGLFLVRRRWPGLLAAWLSYLVILAPNSGIIRINDQIAADRYTYLATLGWVMVAAAGFCRLWRMSSRWHPGASIELIVPRMEALTDVGPSKWHPGAGIGVIALGLGALLGLTALTRNQCRTWLNSETLWAHDLTHGGNSSFVPHHNFGLVLFNQGKYEAAAAHFTEALRLTPGKTDIHNNLGTALARQRRFAEAEAHFAEAIRLDPGFVRAHFNLGLVHAGQGKYKEAAAHYANAIRLQPGNVRAHLNLGNVLSRLGDYAAAKAHYAAAIWLDHGCAEAYNASALIMAACPEAKFRDGQGAVALATRACELTTWKDPRFLNSLAAAQAEAGDFNAAVSSQKRAIELLTDQRQQDDYRSRLVLYQSKKPYRQESPQLAPAEARS